MNKQYYDLIIIGGGPAGLSAAIYSGRFKIKTLLLGEIIGGTVLNTTQIENYPGFKIIDGFDLAMKLKEHCQEYKESITLIDKKVINIEKENKDIFKISCLDMIFYSKAIIFATGTKRRKLNIKGEKEFEGKGVHYCAVCDAPFYKSKIAGVIGGSDSAAKAALMLSDYAEKVYIIYRGNKIRSEPVRTKRIEDNKKIEIIYNTNIIEIIGNQKVHTLKLDKEYKGSINLNLDGVFIEIGSIADPYLAKQINLDITEKGEIKTTKEGETNIRGVFAAGDCTDRNFKQIITACAEGVSAAYATYQYLNNIK
jgi:thioredoxin-disulfide reductase